MMRIQVERGREGKTGQQCFIFFPETGGGQSIKFS